MRKPTNVQPEVLNDLTAKAPPVRSLDALANSGLLGMLQTIVDPDNPNNISINPRLKRIVEAQLKKADEEGDTSAYYAIQSTLSKARSRTPTVTITDKSVNDNRTQFFLSEARRQLVMLIDNKGPMPSVMIAEMMHCPLTNVTQALDHKWFEKDAECWFITSTAREEVLQSLGNPQE